MLKPDVTWAVQQYEAVRSLLPTAKMPEQSMHAANLGALADRFDVFLLDAFGVLNVGEMAIDGAAQRVRFLQELGKRVLVLTNGARHPAEQAQQKFSTLGFSFDLADIVSSRDALKAALRMPPQGRFWGVMCSEDSQIETLSVPWCRLEDDGSIYDEAFGFLLMSASEWTDASLALLRESLAKVPRPVMVGNPDIVAPREDHLSLEPGYYAHELSRTIGLNAEFFGKPFANIYDLAFGRLGSVDPSRVVMVGDTLHTDVLGGAAYGVKTVLVTDHGLFAGCDPASLIAATRIVPDFVIPTI